MCKFTEFFVPWLLVVQLLLIRPAHVVIDAYFHNSFLWQ